MAEVSLWVAVASSFAGYATATEYLQGVRLLYVSVKPAGMRAKQPMRMRESRSSERHSSPFKVLARLMRNAA
jgi:hypothetical protein